MTEVSYIECDYCERQFFTTDQHWKVNYQPAQTAQRSQPWQFAAIAATSISLTPPRQSPTFHLCTMCVEKFLVKNSG